MQRRRLFLQDIKLPLTFSWFQPREFFFFLFIFLFPQVRNDHHFSWTTLSTLFLYIVVIIRVYDLTDHVLLQPHDYKSSLTLKEKNLLAKKTILTITFSDNVICHRQMIVILLFIHLLFFFFFFSFISFILLFIIKKLNMSQQFLCESQLIHVVYDCSPDCKCGKTKNTRRMEKGEYKAIRESRIFIFPWQEFWGCRLDKLLYERVYTVTRSHLSLPYHSSTLSLIPIYIFETHPILSSVKLPVEYWNPSNIARS